MSKQDLAASIADPPKNNTWVDDNTVTNCVSCNSEFGLLVRKHHCRHCGNIFCWNCTNYEIEIPDFITDRPYPEDIWNPSHYISSLKKRQERVCAKCYDMIFDKMGVYRKLIDQLHRDKNFTVHNLHNYDLRMQRIYMDLFRNIQYYLPNHRFTPHEQTLLLNNAPYLSRHSKYMVQFIKSIQWDDVELLENHQKINMVMGVLNSPQSKTCIELSCTRICGEELSFDDCVNILYQDPRGLPNELLVYLFDILTSASEEVVYCHLPFFVSLIKDGITKEKDFIHLSVYNLLNRFGSSSRVIHQTYWMLMSQENACCQQEWANIVNFISLFRNNSVLEKIKSGYRFFNHLVTSLDNPVAYLKREFDSYKPIPLPFAPEIVLEYCYYNTVVTKKSATNPVIISFKTNHGMKKILIKKESVVNDMVVMNLISICDIILKESEERINLGIIRYHAVPITRDAGLIEVVDDAETVYDIHARKETIFQNIVCNNESSVIKDVMRTYMHSLVSSTIQSYLLGFGDRHEENIMMTRQGTLFHIDFGFIMGNEAHPISQDIKINADMIAPLGGDDGDQYHEYLKLCSDCIVYLRKYFSVFFILLNQIPPSKQINEAKIEKFIMSHFQPRQTDVHFSQALSTIIRNSKNSYPDKIRDMLHYHSREKTIPKKINKIWKGLGNIIGS